MDTLAREAALSFFHSIPTVVYSSWEEFPSEEQTLLFLVNPISEVVWLPETKNEITIVVSL